MHRKITDMSNTSGFLCIFSSTATVLPGSALEVNTNASDPLIFVAQGRFKCNCVEAFI